MMDDPGRLAPCDDLIEAARFTRRILDGEPGPWILPPATVRGLAVLTISVLHANAALNGITGPGAQAAHVRDLLTMAVENATLLAMAAENGPGDG